MAGFFMAKSPELTGIEQMVQQGLQTTAESSTVNGTESIPYPDAVEYTTLQDALARYVEDPYGDRKFAFLQQAFGITDPDRFLIEAGLNQYVDLKRGRGAFVGAVKSHAFQATPYNFADIIAAGHAAQAYDIPTAVICLGYGQDTFHLSSEKMEAIGRQNYFVGYDNKGRPMFSSVSVVPHAVRTASGLREIDVVEEIGGRSFDDIFVRLRHPLDPRGATIVNKEADGSKTEYIEGAIGLTWDQVVNNPHSKDANPGYVTLTQLHRFLFETTVNRLRAMGHLPGEDNMALIFTDITKLSNSLLKHAQRKDCTLATLGLKGKPQEILANFLCMQPHEALLILRGLTGDEGIRAVHRAVMTHHESLTNDERDVMMNISDMSAERILKFVFSQLGMMIDSNSGLLTKNGVADPAVYYPVYTSLLDVDFTSLNEESWFFTGKINRMQKLLRQHGINIPSIRVPHFEIPDIDITRIHPTGRYVDIRGAETAVTRSITAQLEGLSKAAKGRMGPQIEQTKWEHMRTFYTALGAGDAGEFERISQFVMTQPVLQWWASVIANLPEKL